MEVPFIIAVWMQYLVDLLPEQGICLDKYMFLPEFTILFYKYLFSLRFSIYIYI